MDIDQLGPAHRELVVFSLRLIGNPELGENTFGVKHLAELWREAAEEGRTK